ncbi:hypothetical protein [Rhodococcus sp. P1Y]|uniref:hypothetical protein n=1 Tax=Rhodococcus sp. P1Y TaxID=1302308 RepID=UPI00129371DF|nr:hypothetical protein [Rhodococcus sp. P1Y]
MAEASAAVAGEVDGLPSYPHYALMVDYLAYSGVRAAENTGLEVGDLTFTTGPTSADGCVHGAVRRAGAPDQGT